MSELLLTEREIIEDAFFEGGLTNEPYEPLTVSGLLSILILKNEIAAK
jgi:hypothetical protein